ncbi:MAG: lysine--tRNA ligase, partial [Syntrophales bacterium]
MEDSELLRKKKEKIESLKADGIELYPNDAKVKDTAASVMERFAQLDSDSLSKIAERFSIAGRLMA